MKQRNKKVDFLVYWYISCIGNMLAGKAKIPGRGIIKASEGTIRAEQDF